jgi:uncharacterized protein (DUF433 family)
MGAAQPDLGYLYAPLYSYAEADYLAHAGRGAARRWLAGYNRIDAEGNRVSSRPITSTDRDLEAVSFLDLMEVVAVAGLKDLGFSIRQIRGIVENCQKLLHVERPLVSLTFKTDGREIFVPHDDSLLEVGRRRGARAWDEVLNPFLQKLDYTEKLASRWWPLGKDQPIIVDPSYGYGLPVVVNSGVRTEIIRERFGAGDSYEQIAQDFGLEPPDVERALQFEVQRAA